MTSFKRYKTNRVLAVLSSVSFFLVLVLTVALFITIFSRCENTNQEVCLTPGCIHAASTILKYIDVSVNPCDDFYQFACGGFLNNTNIPEDKSSVSLFTTVGDVVSEQLKLIIERKLPPNASKPYKLYKKMYDICMNTTAIEVDGLPTVESLLKDVGGWPVLEGNNWNEAKFDWKQTMYKFRKLGLSTNYFIGFSITADKKNSSRRILYVGQPGLSLSREYLIKGIRDKFVSAYYNFMVDEGVLFGANRVAALKELNETLELEIAIAKLCLAKEETRNITALYNPMTIEELQSSYPNIPWLEYITGVLDIPDINITEDDIINVSVPKFLTNVDALIRSTPKRVQANYIIGKVAFSSIYSLPERFRKRQEEYRKIFNGHTETPPRWKTCVGVASGSTYHAIAASYVRAHFNNTAKKEVEGMVIGIKNEFIDILKANNWMDDETRAKALEKATAMVAYIGYPDELLNEKIIEHFYSNLEITSDNYFKAGLSLASFSKNYSYGRLREPVNKTEWMRHSYPTSVNAFYSATENSIKLPAGILQGLFFSNDRPRYLNYGSIGFIIGHEITHGFDDKGSQFDKSGNLVNWWKEGTKMAFTRKAQCIIDKYGNYTVPEVDLNLNGINTQGENIADNGGVKGAYLAYQSWIRKNGPEAKLPGLNYTPNQLFWISTANVWCKKYRPESLKVQVTTSFHSPSKYRILGSFSNTKLFSNDFSCPLGSSMNPESKCDVW